MAQAVSKAEQGTALVVRDGIRISRDMRTLIQQSAESTRALARLYELHPRTVAKWKRRLTVDEARRGPKVRGPWALSQAEETIILVFRRCTRFSLDDCHHALRPAIPNLTRSSLQRCLCRNGLNRLESLPDALAEWRTQRRPGTFFAYLTPVRTVEGVHHTYTAFDQFTKVFHVYSADTPSARHAVAFIGGLVRMVPYRVERLVTVGDLTICDGQQATADRSVVNWAECVADACAARGIAHCQIESDRLPPVGWTAADEFLRPRYSTRYREPRDEADRTFKWLVHYTFSTRLKALGGRTPHAHLYALWRETPELFLRNPKNLIFNDMPSLRPPLKE